MSDRQRAVVGKYLQKSISKRIEAFFLDNVGRIATRSQVLQVARDPETGVEPENWHQRLSELRTDSGYTILSKRDEEGLNVGEYVLQSTKKRANAGRRVRCSPATWAAVVQRAKNTCEWNEAGQSCSLEEGGIDPIGGGTVHLTPDHMTPHSAKAAADSLDINQWRALCGRHQVIKKNYWDNTTGKVNAYAVVQAATTKEKRKIFSFLKDFFGPAKKL